MDCNRSSPGDLGRRSHQRNVLRDADCCGARKAGIRRADLPCAKSTAASAVAAGPDAGRMRPAAAFEPLGKCGMRWSYPRLAYPRLAGWARSPGAWGQRQAGARHRRGNRRGNRPRGCLWDACARLQGLPMTALRPRGYRRRRPAGWAFFPDIGPVSGEKVTPRSASRRVHDICLQKAANRTVHPRLTLQPADLEQAA